MAGERWTRSSVFFLVASAFLLVSSVVEFVIALAIASPGGGANIGAGIAIMSAISAAVGLFVGAALRYRATKSVRVFLWCVGLVALLFSVQAVLLIAAGIAEET